MQTDQPTYDEVMSDTDSFYEGRDERPDVEVREQVTEDHRTGITLMNDTRKQYTFFVVDHHAERVLFRSRTAQPHGRPSYDGQKARALGYRDGYRDALPFE